MTSNAPDVTPPDASTATDPIPYADPLVPAGRDAGLRFGITRGDVAALAVRIFGIYLLLQALPLAMFVISQLLQSPRLRLSGFMSSFGFVFYGIYLVVFTAAGVWLLVKAVRVAAWLLPNTTGNAAVPVVHGSPDGLQAVAFSIVGLYLAASAFPDVAAILAQYARFQSDRAMFPQLIKPGIEFVVGLVLFFRSKRIAAYWQQTRAVSAAHAGDDSGPL
jgi:hypothetical protein